MNTTWNTILKSVARLAAALVLLAALPLTALEPAAPQARRIGLFVGANQGGPGRQTLLWAVRDSQRMSTLMQELGGMVPNDTWFLADPDASTFRSTLAKVSTVLESGRKSSKRLEFMFYYSGHSDEKGLLLKDGPIPYSEIKESLKSSNADISIVMLDSCSSGSFTRTKGGTRTKPFLYDDSINMKGYAYITSSSADEAAQESDRLGASFFTHYMISGLRGAADRNADGRVNMNEAYEYAFQETLASTGSSKDGPQHPSYDIQLQGSGELILSDLSQPSASLVLGADLEGRVFIRDGDKNLVVELGKARGRILSLALQPGTYTVRLESADRSLEASVALADRKIIGVSLGDFRNAPRQENRPRGDAADAAIALDPAAGPASPDPAVPAAPTAPAAPSAADSPASEEGPATRAARAAHQDLSKAAAEFNQAAAAFAEGVATDILGDLRQHFVPPQSTDTSANASPGAAPATETPASGGDITIIMPSQAPEGSPAPGATPDSGSPERIQVPFNLSLVPGVGLGPDGDTSESLFSVGLLLAQTGYSNAFMAAGIGTIALHDALGIQTAGIYTTAGELAGMQAAGIFNTTRGNATGVQSAGIFNTAGGNLQGLQSAGIFNSTAGLVQGVQAAGIFNEAKGEVQGVQSAGLFNLAGTGISGVQAAALFNSARKVDGFQAAGLFNTAGGVNGGQAAGLFNTTGKLAGVQAAGLFNTTSTMDGIQVAGLFNYVGEGSGAQIGLVNLGKKMDGLPVGLLNIYLEGIHDLSYWYSLQDRHWIGIDSGNDTFYSGVYAGYHAETPIEELAGLALGVNTGVRLHADEFFFDANLNLERYATGSTAEERLVSLFSEPAIHLVPGVRLQVGLDFDFVIASLGLDIKGLFALVGEASEYFALDESNYLGFGWTTQVFGTTGFNWIKFLPLFKVSFSI